MARLGHVSATATMTAIATVPLAVVMMVLCLLLGGGECQQIDARGPATYIVGGEDGWDLTIPMYTWPEGKTFYAGDILVFNYNDQDSNVVVVNRTAYETCTPNDGAIVYNSGHDRIQIAYGSNFFIGTYSPNDCPAGLKMAIKGLARPRRP